MKSLDRVLGFFPMSMATSLALEGLFHLGEYAGNSGEPPGNIMPALWVNLRTVIRNAINAFPNDGQIELLNSTLQESVEQDIDAIRDAVRQNTSGTELRFYITTHKSLTRAFPEAKFKQPAPGKQQILADLEAATLRYLQEQFDDLTALDFDVFDWKLSGKKATTLLTHHPVDLLSYYEFPDLRLLESHTGKVKTRKQWYTKLNVPKGTTVIPFTKSMLTIFGDGSHILSQDIKIRRTLIALGEKFKWNGLTTHSRMLTNIKTAYEPHLYDYVKKTDS